jgi:hypothetical protein
MAIRAVIAKRKRLDAGQNTPRIVKQATGSFLAKKFPRRRN